MGIKKVLLIGALPTNDPKTHGGTTILVEQLNNYCREKGVPSVIIRTNVYSGRLSFLKNYLYVVLNYLKLINNTDVVFSNVASNGMYFLAPLLLFIARVKGKKFVSRIFGGNSIGLYNAKNGLKRYLLKYVFIKSDILFFETKYLVDYFLKINKNTFWFPNTRRKPNVTRNINRMYERRFVYVGQIKEEKGIGELIDVFNALDDSYVLTVYGNIVEEKYRTKLENKNIIYKGEIDHKSINNVLSQNDVLILPSYREGYPGVIIEAFGVGLPVIATKLPSIQEMVDTSCGFLVNVKDANSLQIAIENITDETYCSLSKSSLNKFNSYIYEDVYKIVFNKLEGLV